MKRAAQERHVSPDGLAAGQSADGLVDHGLENRSGQVFLGGTVIDQRLNIGLGKYAAAGRDGIKRMIVLGVLIQTGGVRLQKRSHLVDEGTGTAGADTVHTLLHIAALEVNDFCVLTAKLYRHVGLGSCLLQSRRYSYDFLYEGYAQMVRQGQSA